MAKKRRLRIPNALKEYADIDYLDKLNDEEREFILNYVDAELCNNHRKYPMYTEHPEYDRIKKEIYSRINAANTRCDYSKARGSNRLSNFSELETKEKVGLLERIMYRADSKKEPSDMLLASGNKSVEDMLKGLIKDTISELESAYDKETVLVRFYTRMRKIIKRERKIKLNDKKIEREKSQSN